MTNKLEQLKKEMEEANGIADARKAFIAAACGATLDAAVVAALDACNAALDAKKAYNNELNKNNDK